MNDQMPPREGTRAAIRYWAGRTREALRAAEVLLDDKDAEGAAKWAMDAAGCADEFEQAITAYGESHAHVAPVAVAINDQCPMNNDDRATEFNPLGGAARGVGRCVCAAGPGTNPACEVHP